MTLSIPICFDCKNYKNQSDGVYYCKAFPKGIPDDILFSYFDHTKKHQDQDNDIVFEPIEDK